MISLSISLEGSLRSTFSAADCFSAGISPASDTSRQSRDNKKRTILSLFYCRQTDVMEQKQLPPSVFALCNFEIHEAQRVQSHESPFS